MVEEEAALRQQLARLQAELEAAGKGLPSPNAAVPGSDGSSGSGKAGRKKR